MSSEVKRAHRGMLKKVDFFSSGGTASSTRQAVLSASKDCQRTGVRRSGTKHIYRVCGADLCLGLNHCDNALSRPRKSSVPQSRPFKAEESRPETVPVRVWLALRAASTSLVSSAYVNKARQGSLVHSKHEGSGAVAHGDKGGLAGPRKKSRSCARPWYAPVRLLAPANRPSKFSRSCGIPCSSRPSMVSPSHSFTPAEECGGETMRRPSAGTVQVRSTGEKTLLVEDDAFLPEVIDGASELGGERGQRLGLAVLLLVTRHPGFAPFTVAYQ